jgi:hypothetical protein
MSLGHEVAEMGPSARNQVIQGATQVMVETAMVSRRQQQRRPMGCDRGAP